MIKRSPPVMGFVSCTFPESVLLHATGTGLSLLQSWAYLWGAYLLLFQLLQEQRLRLEFPANSWGKLYYFPIHWRLPPIFFFKPFPAVKGISPEISLGFLAPEVLQPDSQFSGLLYFLSRLFSAILRPFSFLWEVQIPSRFLRESSLFDSSQNLFIPKYSSQQFSLLVWLHPFLSLFKWDWFLFQYHAQQLCPVSR